MITVTGFVPSILYNEMPHYDNLYQKGTDINIDINKDGNTTHLSAITLGNGTWDIEELDDNANIFPQYDEGDVISLDVLKKVFMKEVNSSYIYSFNTLGKIKYGIKDTKNKIKDKLSFFTDDLDEQDALNFIAKYYPGAKMYAFDFYKKQDGKIYKCLFSSQGKYYVLCLLRNGNDLRFLDDDDYDFTPIYSTGDAQQAVDVYNSYPEEVIEDNVIEDEDGDKDENAFTKESLEDVFNAIPDDAFDVSEVKCFTVIDDNTAIAILFSKGQNRFYLGWEMFVKDKKGRILPQNGNFTQITDKNNLKNVIMEVADEYEEYGGKNPKINIDENEITSSRRKKSKYNGKNVTGYEDGSLGKINNVIEAI